MGDDTSIQRWGSPYRQLRGATHLFVHPDFNLRTYSSDIAVIRVDHPFTATNRLRPLPRSIATPLDDITCHLAGW
jgi:Trypsin